MIVLFPILFIRTQCIRTDWALYTQQIVWCGVTMNYVYQLKSMFESDAGDDFKNYLFQTDDSRIDNNLLPNIDPMLCFSNVDLVSPVAFFYKFVNVTSS